ncbi:apoptosis-associated speck-like protein containing a CARD [Lacerta agilis]|uniref:apoptosis-associated speck-like protein containing a CARD n=1 Tax=Lacerta agilis TaxID=80427 RepID=UPI0014191D5E|nr:apoptosis-associated speck-like protein containing a CARD [Lacerta agilis]
MAKSARQRLMDALENLHDGELRKFKAKLAEIPLEEGHEHIPRGRLEKADAVDLPSLLIGYYKQDYALRLTAQVLEEIHCKDQAQKLRGGGGGEKTACCNPEIPVPSTSTTSGRNETQPPAPPEQHFIERHREALIQRTATVEGILDVLHGDVLDDEQYQKISAKSTNQEKMRELYRLLPSWNQACKDKLYQALKMKNRFLVEDLEG